MNGDRGQAITLEGIIGGLVLLVSVLVALQMTAVTPLSASTSSQHIENQLDSAADGVLAASVEDGSLERTVLYYNDSRGAFINSTYQGYYAGQPPNTTFGRTLESTFDQRGIAYNVYVTHDFGGDDRTRRMIYRGEPSDNAIRASRTIVLTDDSPLYNHTDGDGIADPRPLNVSSAAGYYMRDQSTSALYNVVTVEVVVWRI